MKIVELESSLHIEMPPAPERGVLIGCALGLIVAAAVHWLSGAPVVGDSSGLVLVAALLAAGILLSDGGGSIALCRSDARCLLRQARPGALQRTLSLPLSEVREARLERWRCHEADAERFRVVVETRTGSLPLTRGVTVGRAELESVCALINAFIRHERSVLAA